MKNDKIDLFAKGSCHREERKKEGTVSSAQRYIKCHQKQWNLFSSHLLELFIADFADEVLTKLVDFASWLKVLSNKSTLHETVC